MRYLEVRISDGFVTNAIVWDGVEPYSREGHDLVKCDDAPGVWIGWQRVEGEWVAPEQNEEQ